MSEARRLRSWALPSLMAMCLAAYAALHSPLRDRIAALLLGRVTHTRYFSDGETLSFASGIDAVVALVAIAAASGAAAWIADRYAEQPYEWPLVFGITGFALIVTPAAWAGGIATVLGAPILRPPIGPLLTTVPSVLIVAFAFSRGWRPTFPRVARVGGISAVVCGLAALLLLASAALSLLQPPTGFDALAYHGPLAVYVWRDGDISTFLDRSLSGFALAWPASAELWFGLLLIAGGERLANLGQLPFALLGGWAVAALARRLGARTRSATLAGAAFVMAPLVALQAGVQLNDLVTSALLLCGAALACAPLREWSMRRTGLIGMALGLATATKVSILPGAAAVAIFAVVTLLKERTHTRDAGRLACALALTGLVVVAPWWIRNTVRFGNPVYPAALPLIGRGFNVGDWEQKDGRFVPARAAWPAYPLLEPLNDQSGFGAVLVVAALPGFLLALTARRKRRTPVYLFGALIVAMLPPWWLFSQHEPRHLLALGGFAFAFVPIALATGPRRTRRVAIALVAVAAAFTAVSVFDQALIPRARQPLERGRFYDLVWNIDPIVAGGPESEPLLYNTGYANLSYAGDYALLGPGLGRVLLTVDTDATTDLIVRAMQKAGVRYAYVPAGTVNQEQVAAKYGSAFFTLEHVSDVTSGDGAGTKRYLYRLRDEVVSR
jgi:hypothetical protein